MFPGVSNVLTRAVMSQNLTRNDCPQRLPTQIERHRYVRKASLILCQRHAASFERLGYGLATDQRRKTEGTLAVTLPRCSSRQAPDPLRIETLS